jgi:hypothetical protein
MFCFEEAALYSEFKHFFEVVQAEILKDGVSFDVCLEVGSDGCLKGVLKLLIFRSEGLAADDLAATGNCDVLMKNLSGDEEFPVRT